MSTMARHKPYLYTILVIAPLLLIWGVYSINQPPKWVGATEDGQWQAAYDYNREPDAPGDWLGVIYWQGEGEVFLVDAEFTQNGQPVHKAEFYGEAILTEGHQSEDFIHSFEPMFTNKNDHLQLLIH